MTDYPAALAISAATFAVFAQAADGQLTGIPGIVTTMTSTGVLVWYLWWTTTKTVPSLVDKFEEQLQGLRESFERQMREEREHCRNELMMIRDMTRVPPKDESC